MDASFAFLIFILIQGIIMPFTPASPLTGATVTGLTTPTYTLTSDVAPSSNGKQYAVTALGGTQTGVDAHSVSKPFTLSFFRPATLKTLPSANPVTGVIKNIPRNIYKMITRKGAKPASTADDTIRITTTFDVPAGVDSYEPEELNAALSAHIGALSNQSDGIATVLRTGVL